MSEACLSEPLVLSALSSTATIQPGDLALALWVLSTPDPPVQGRAPLVAGAQTSAGPRRSGVRGRPAGRGA